MDKSMAIDIAELRKLPEDMKMEIVHALVVDLQHAGLPISLPQEELDEIDRRYRRMVEHPEETLSTEEMWARVDALLK